MNKKKIVEKPHRILIASANPLFGKGIQTLLTKQGYGSDLIRLVHSMDETVEFLNNWFPDLVIVDHDDETIEIQSFLNSFVNSKGAMQVVIVSLQDNGSAVVYDRRTLTPDQTIDWLDLSAEPEMVENKPEKHKRSENMKHLVIVGVLVIILTFLTNALLQSIGLLPAQASAQAVTIDRLFNVHFLFISFLFSLIFVFMVYSMVVFRKKEGEPDVGRNISGSNRLEVLWTVIPLAVVVYISYLGSQNLAEIRREDPQAMEVKVTAGQWYWRYEYPDYGIVSQSLNLPVNKQVLLKMTSADVIHSFWVPEFRVKQDILPGENLVKELRFTPTEIGNYTVLCAELCGGAHAYMTSPVNVMSDSDFSAWLQSEMSASSSDPVARGERLSSTKGCIGCHTLDGKKGVGPSWKGLSGATVELMDGSTVTVDREYLIAGIVDPNKQVAKGFPPNVMPQNYQDQLTEQEISDIVSFIESLK